jgi:transcription initiation factor TFIIH subunit 4
MSITNKGFKYLLKDTYTQIWTLLLSYIENSGGRNIDKKEILSFLFQLSFLTFGQGYPTSSLSPAQLQVLQDLREFGIIYQKSGNSSVYYPTQLAITLSSGKVDFLTTDKTADLFVVIEPNYRLYAYTSDQLQISIMGLFVKMKIHLPNLAHGVITRESIRAALMNGITANEIIGYLQQHAHPQMERNTPGMKLPETVQDQIRLWESERNRVSYDDCVLYDSFPSVQYFEKLLKFATDINVVTWASTTKRQIIVSPAGHEAIKQYIKSS